MLTGLPARATAAMKSVCRQRNAGVCRTSTTAAATGTSASVCTSVSTGTPTWRLDLGEDCETLFHAGTAERVPEVRLALSYDDLKMNGIPSSAQMAFNCPATSIWSCSDSTTHGPGDEEQRPVEPGLESAELHGVRTTSDRGDE